MNQINIAIDGPSGAGKSTLARNASKVLGFFYVDTGAIYRTVSLACYRNGVDPSNEASIKNILLMSDINLDYDIDGNQRMWLNSEDVSEQIRTPEISLLTSQISALPSVRAFLLEKQRELARRHNVIMDGRDIGTVVLPNATVKIYLTAAPEARAQRRYAELRQRGLSVSYEEILRDVKQRDYNDIHRKNSPLCMAKDAQLLDTTLLDLDQSLAALIGMIREGISSEK